MTMRSKMMNSDSKNCNKDRLNFTCDMTKNIDSRSNIAAL